MVSISTNELKNGWTLVLDGNLMQVIEFQHVKPGKGHAFVRSKLKNIRTGAVTEKTFRAGETVERANIDKREMQYLYRDGEGFVFMDNETYEQLNVASDSVGDGKNFLTSGMNVDLLFDGSKVLDVRLPSHVVLEVTDTEPGFKGNTATGATKPAKVETGFTLNVPLFIEEGEKLRIDTRTGEYVERSKE